MNRKQFLATIIGLPAAIKAIVLKVEQDRQFVNGCAPDVTYYKVGGKSKWTYQDEIYPGTPHEPFHVKLDKNWLLEGRIVGKRSTIALNELLDKFIKVK